MPSFLNAVAIAAATLSAPPVSQEPAGTMEPASTAPTQETAPEREPIGETDILVNRTLKEERQHIMGLARDVLGRIKTHEPLPRFQGEMCLNVIGIREEHLADFRARIIENAKLAGVRIAKDKCYSNALVAIVPDARGELKTLRKARHPVFGDLPASARNRILNSREPAFVIQTTEIRGPNDTPANIDPLATSNGIGLLDNPGGMGYGSLSRLSLPFSINFRSSVVVIDADAAEGKTATQLADYASLRLLLPTKEIEQINEDAPETIMTLFMDPENAPAELTVFDLGFLRAGYKMARNIAAGGLLGQTARVITNPKAR